MDDEPQADRLAAIARAQADLSASGLSPLGALNVVAERAVALTGGHGAGVELVEDDELVLTVATGSLSGVRGRRLACFGSLAGQCVRTGQALRCDDTHDDPRGWRGGAGNGYRVRVGGARHLGWRHHRRAEGRVTHPRSIHERGRLGGRAPRPPSRREHRPRGARCSALAKERDSTSAIVEAVAALVVVLDPHGSIVRFNRACEETTGWNASRGRRSPLLGPLRPARGARPRTRHVLRAEGRAVPEPEREPLGHPRRAPAPHHLVQHRHPGRRRRARVRHRCGGRRHRGPRGACRVARQRGALSFARAERVRHRGGGR